MIGKVKNEKGKLLIEGSEATKKAVSIVVESDGKSFSWIPLKVLKDEGDKLLGTVAGLPFYSAETLLEVPLSAVRSEDKEVLRRIAGEWKEVVVVLIPYGTDEIRLSFCENSTSSEGFKEVVKYCFQLFEDVKSLVKEELEEKGRGLEEKDEASFKPKDEIEKSFAEPEKDVFSSFEEEVFEEEVSEKSVDVAMTEKREKKEGTELPSFDRLEGARPTAKQASYVRDLMKKNGFAQGIIEKFLELTSREEASKMIDYLRERKKKLAIELINHVLNRGLASEGTTKFEEVKEVRDENVKEERDFSEEDFDLEEEFNEEELPW